MCQERGDLQLLPLPTLQQDRRHLLQREGQVLHPLTLSWEPWQRTQGPSEVFVPVVLIKEFFRSIPTSNQNDARVSFWKRLRECDGRKGRQARPKARVGQDWG